MSTLNGPLENPILTVAHMIPRNHYIPYILATSIFFFHLVVHYPNSSFPKLLFPKWGKFIWGPVL